MVRERIQEVVDFATTESPYRSANKGWINEDVYLALGEETKDSSITQGNELANISLFWKPITQILLILFAVISIATVFVFVAVSFSHGKFSFPNLINEEVALTQNVSIELSGSREKKEYIPSNFVDEQKDASMATQEQQETKAIEIKDDLELSESSDQLNQKSPLVNEFVRTQPKKAITAVDLFQSKSR